MDFAEFTTETERLRLRPYRESDFAAFAELHGRPDVARFLMWPPRDAKAAREAFDRHKQRLRLDEDGDAVTLAAFQKDDDSFVGEFVLFLRSVEHRGGEVGYIVHPRARGQGLATEGARAMLALGFDRVGLHRIVGRIDARNMGSAAVLSRVGMRREAHFVKNELVKGEWTDEVVYAILSEEWSSASANRTDIATNTVAPASTRDSSSASPPA